MHQHLQSLKIIILALILATGISYVYAWTGPTEAPPGGNTPPPVNVGIVDQVKDGGLGLNSLAVFGNGTFSGYVQIGEAVTPCEDSVKGSLRFNSTEGCLQLCVDSIWKDVTCGTTSQITASLSANPGTIIEGENSTLSWSSFNADSCNGTNFSTSGAVSGSISVTPLQTTNYSVQCDGPGGTATDNSTVTVNPPPVISEYIYGAGDGITVSWGNDIEPRRDGWGWGNCYSGSSVTCSNDYLYCQNGYRWTWTCRERFSDGTMMTVSDSLCGGVHDSPWTCNP